MDKKKLLDELEYSIEHLKSDNIIFSEEYLVSVRRFIDKLPLDITQPEISTYDKKIGFFISKQFDTADFYFEDPKTIHIEKLDQDHNCWIRDEDIPYDGEVPEQILKFLKLLIWDEAWTQKLEEDAIRAEESRKKWEEETRNMSPQQKMGHAMKGPLSRELLYEGHTRDLMKTYRIALNPKQPLNGVQQKSLGEAVDLLEAIRKENEERFGDKS